MMQFMGEIVRLPRKPQQNAPRRPSVDALAVMGATVERAVDDGTLNLDIPWDDVVKALPKER